jgi:hypothetical protein
MGNNTTGYGTEVAACVTMQPNGEHTLASVEWQCDFWTTGRRMGRERCDRLDSLYGGNGKSIN